MIPWSTDAREIIKDLQSITDDSIKETIDIRRFLKKDRYNIIVATKGFGKSLVLLAKRKSLVGIHYVVPKNLLLDVPELYLDTLSRDALSILYDPKEFIKLWGISLLVVAINGTKETFSVFPPRNLPEILSRFVSNESCKTVAGTLNAILHCTRKEFAKLCDEYGNVLVPMAQDISVPIAIFVDNVDECFKSNKELWYISQSSLLEAAYKTIRLNPRIKVYVTVRKEAYLKCLPGSEMSLQYGGVSLLLSYSKSELQEIFERNIRADDSDVLAEPDLLRKNPVQAFLGASKIEHGYVMEDEDAFDYIYRHTLRRPRDLMEIGAAIARTPVADRKPHTRGGLASLKAIINDAGSRICDSYLQEVMPHLDITMGDCEKLCTLVNTNILSTEQIKNLCMVFNGGKAECLQQDCSICKTGKHVFCEFFKAGLLGVVSIDPATGSLIQQFSPVGEKLFAESPILPESDFYLIHPVLDDKIRRMNAQYRRHINSQNIVGYDRSWRRTRVPPSESISRPIVFISSTMDLKSFRDIAEEVVDENHFEIRRSEYENSPDSLSRVLDLASRCHLFVGVLGPRYGDSVEGKSICELEFEAAFSNNPEKILVYALDAPSSNWNESQQNFLDRIQSLDAMRYARGERITIRNFRQRLQKDFLERIAYLIGNGEQSGGEGPE